MDILTNDFVQNLRTHLTPLGEAIGHNAFTLNTTTNSTSITMATNSGGFLNPQNNSLLFKQGNLALSNGEIAENGSQFNMEYNNSDNELQYDQRCQMIDMNTNYSYWNLTCDTALEYGLPLYGYCMPFLLITTIISNSLIVIVLSKKNMATPTNFVLMSK